MEWPFFAAHVPSSSVNVKNSGSICWFAEQNTHILILFFVSVAKIRKSKRTAKLIRWIFATKPHNSFSDKTFHEIVPKQDVKEVSANTNSKMLIYIFFLFQIIHYRWFFCYLMQIYNKNSNNILFAIHKVSGATCFL